MLFPIFDIEPLIRQWKSQGWSYKQIAERVKLHIEHHTEDPEKRRQLMKLAYKIIGDTLSNDYAR